MRLTILQVGEAPQPMRAEFGRYPTQFQEMFALTGGDFSFETIHVLDGQPLPDPHRVEGVIITGSASSVYEDHDWLPPLRDFIRTAYALRTPMLGVCFGHQLIAQALGGDVRKSEKGWGIGRHTYRVAPGVLAPDQALGSYAAMASHQDQVITPPKSARVFLSSDFTPNAGLVYDNGAIVTVQPHPEFDTAFSLGLVELRRNNPLSDEQTDKVARSLQEPVQRIALAEELAAFLTRAGMARKAA